LENATVKVCRVKIRSMMAGIALLGVVFWLAFTTFDVAFGSRDRWLLHAYEERITGSETSFLVLQHPAPFWARYWRKLLNRPWPGSYECACGPEWRQPGTRRVVMIAAGIPAAEWDSAQKLSTHQHRGLEVLSQVGKLGRLPSSYEAALTENEHGWTAFVALVPGSPDAFATYYLNADLQIQSVDGGP
jgi:hypothetical protein